jgi:phosphonate C-P lyase system protein PhnG
MRSEGLAAAARVRRDELVALADDVAASLAVEVVEAPAAASVMLELSSRTGTFCLTEVVVTTARVRVRANDGWGCVMGFDPAGALAGALCDALADERVEVLARRALADEAAARAERSRALAATKV